VIKTSELSHLLAPRGPADPPLDGTTLAEVGRLMNAHPRAPAVQVHVEPWPAARIAGLHTRGDCFVSLARAEGWHLGAFDACAYGNPVVMTGWGGQLAYLDPAASYHVAYDLVRKAGRADSSRPDEHWAEPHLDHAVELLREIAADPAAARARAAPLRDHVRTEFAPGRVIDALARGIPELGIPRVGAQHLG
jgi:hypothetical protein